MTELEKKLAQVIKDIAGYTFPTYDKEGGKYVPLENAFYLRQLARDAVKELKL